MFTVVCLASKSETARVGFYCGRGNQNTITSDVQSERNFCDWQHAFVSRNQSACFACVSIKTMGLHRGTNATDKKGGKKKAYSLLTCDLRDKTAALCAYRGGSNTLYDCIILHGSSSPLHPMVDTGSPRSGTGRPASLIHSPPRCLCQVIAGGKRKTDQYISHGTDR